jgi:galactoside O-acetyltransferase
MTSKSPFYTNAELAKLGRTWVGRRVQVSRLTQYYGFQGQLGDHSRIDDYCIIKGQVDIGCYVHISAFCMLGGTDGTISFGDFSTTAAYVALYTASDDYELGCAARPEARHYG